MEQDSTATRLRVWAQIAKRPESWPLELLFVLVVAAIFQATFGGAGVVSTLAWVWASIGNALGSPIVLLLLIIFAPWIFFRGVQRVIAAEEAQSAKVEAERTDLLNAQELRSNDVADQVSRQITNVAEHILQEVGEIANGVRNATAGLEGTVAESHGLIALFAQEWAVQGQIRDESPFVRGVAQAVAEYRNTVCQMEAGTFPNMPRSIEPQLRGHMQKVQDAFENAARALKLPLENPFQNAPHAALSDSGQSFEADQSGEFFEGQKR